MLGVSAVAGCTSTAGGSGSDHLIPFDKPYPLTFDPVGESHTNGGSAVRLGRVRGSAAVRGIPELVVSDGSDDVQGRWLLPESVGSTMRRPGPRFDVVDLSLPETAEFRESIEFSLAVEDAGDGEGLVRGAESGASELRFDVTVPGANYERTITVEPTKN